MSTEDWRDHANCRGMDTALFFPGQSDKAQQAAAKAVCAACPVAAQCAEHAIVNYEDGIWGGMGDNERDRARSATNGTTPRRKREAACGTPSGYQRHRRLSEDACRPCKDAQNAYFRNRRRSTEETPEQREHRLALARVRKARYLASRRMTKEHTR